MWCLKFLFDYRNYKQLNSKENQWVLILLEILLFQILKKKEKMNSNFLLVLKLQISKRLKRKIKPGNQVLKLLLKVLKIWNFDQRLMILISNINYLQNNQTRISIHKEKIFFYFYKTQFSLLKIYRINWKWKN